MANPFLNIFSGALGEANTQRQNTQQLQQALQTLVLQKQLENMFAQQQQKQNFENYQKYSGMFGGGGQPSMPQPQTSQPSLQDIISQMPQDRQPAMSTGMAGSYNPGAVGGIGDIQGRPVDLASALSRSQGQPQSQPQTFQRQPAQGQVGQNPFILSPSSMFSGKMEFIANPAYEKPYLESRNKNQAIANSSRIRKEFIDRPEVKEYVAIKTQVNSMDSLLSKALAGNVNNKVALDQALITMFNKLTDPQSVVRESEYARTPGNLPIINRMSGALIKLQKGGAGMTDDDRKALVLGAKIIANERGKIYQETLDEYKTLAVDYDIDEGLITRGIKDHQDYELGFPSLGGQAVGQSNGQSYVSPFRSLWQD